MAPSLAPLYGCLYGWYGSHFSGHLFLGADGGLHEQQHGRRRVQVVCQRQHDLPQRQLGVRALRGGFLRPERDLPPLRCGVLQPQRRQHGVRALLARHLLHGRRRHVLRFMRRRDV